MKKFWEFVKKINYKNVIKISGIILYTVFVVLITYAVVNTYFKPEPEVITTVLSDEYNEKVDIKILEKTLLENAHLSTAELKLKAEEDYNVGKGIPGITKNQFTVLCEATIKAGFDMGNVKIEADEEEKIVYITVPSAEIKKEDVYIDHSTLKFYDKRFALFPVDMQEDTANALALAEKTAKKFAYETGIIEMANKQGTEIIKGILANVVPKGYTMEAKIAE